MYTFLSNPEFYKHCCPWDAEMVGLKPRVEYDVFCRLCEWIKGMDVDNLVFIHLVLNSKFANMDVDRDLQNSSGDLRILTF